MANGVGTQLPPGVTAHAGDKPGVVRVEFASGVAEQPVAVYYKAGTGGVRTLRGVHLPSPSDPSFNFFTDWKVDDALCVKQQTTGGVREIRIDLGGYRPGEQLYLKVNGVVYPVDLDQKPDGVRPAGTPASSAPVGSPPGDLDRNRALVRPATSVPSRAAEMEAPRKEPLPPPPVPSSLVPAPPREQPVEPAVVTQFSANYPQLADQPFFPLTDERVGKVALVIGKGETDTIDTAPGTPYVTSRPSGPKYLEVIATNTEPRDDTANPPRWRAGQRAREVFVFEQHPTSRRWQGTVFKEVDGVRVVLDPTEVQAKLDGPADVCLAMAASDGFTDRGVLLDLRRIEGDLGARLGRFAPDAGYEGVRGGERVSLRTRGKKLIVMSVTNKEAFDDPGGRWKAGDEAQELVLLKKDQNGLWRATVTKTVNSRSIKLNDAEIERTLGPGVFDVRLNTVTPR